MSQSGKLIDVRSPGEFATGHLPGAENLPLFSDEERALVGTSYKQEGKDHAIQLGLELVGPKLAELSSRAKSIASDLRVYCWRGGMRSEKMAWLFELTGNDCSVLDGGYKAYRQLVLDAFESLEKPIVLQGATGAGKTVILHELRARGEQVIDLEGLANHRGSAFGGIGMPEQPSTQQFQNNCYESIREMDATKRLWIEGESRSIGKVYLPETLWAKMNACPLLEIDVPLAARIERLVEDYGALDQEKLAEGISKVTRKLGGQHAKAALEHLEAGELAEVAGILLSYYDKSYLFSREKYKVGKSEIVPTSTGLASANAELLIETANKLGW